MHCKKSMLSKHRCSNQGLNFRAGFAPKIQKSRQKELPGREAPALKKFSAFRKFLLLWNETPRFRKVRRFSCNAGQIFSVRDSLSLPIRSDCFPILLVIECSLIRKFGTITYFASFRWNNSVYERNYLGFKKYQLRKKFIFR